ncbi:GNAT family protein [Lasiodiplodia theobromae]|uniref:GNAT family protein n=1 Tax=Lasiodiplodia theobromae TaxID=45133 RepID=UPI0015C30F22|nr:GNAT family protein [Lasiodiplodia theobromae]KAF4538039.1 GNAT family protein [Lasiodiplodia theobromae]
MAVRYNPTTNEPYLQFPSPHVHLRLTPMRHSDGPATIAAMNDPRVYMNILSPPFPYLPQHWDQQFATIDAATRRAREELDAVEAWRKQGGSGPKMWVGSGLPFTAIREVVVVEGPEGKEEEERFLGRINIRRKDFRTVVDEGERKALKAANDAKVAGDPEIEWEMGFWLCPSAQGRGVMTTVLRTLMETFFVGYMNVHRLRGSHLDHNKGSGRVLEKCGFVLEGKEADVFEHNSTWRTLGFRVGFFIEDFHFMFLLPFSFFSDHDRIRRPSQRPTAIAMADLFATMASTAQQPVQGDDPSVTTDPQEQSSHQPAPSQTSKRDSEDFDLNLFTTLNPSSDELMGAILSEFNHNLDSLHDAPAPKMQQASTPASTDHTDSSSHDQQKQRPTRRLNNSDLIRSFAPKNNDKSHETRCHQRQPTSPVTQSRKRRLADEPAVACPTPASLEQHLHKLPRTGNYSIADMFMAKAFDNIARLQTPGSSYATHNNWQQSGSSQENPLVVDDDDDDGNSDITGQQHCGTTAQQHGGPPPSYPTAKPATLPETTTKQAFSTCNNAVAFAVEETIPLPPTIGGGHAHRTFTFSPACQISIRRGGRLISIKKDQQVLHFTSNKKKNNNESITKNHTGDGELDESGSCVHGSSSSSVGEDEEADGDQPREVSRFKAVGFGPCSRCQSAPGGSGTRLCDRGFPCGPCLAEAGGDVGVAMKKCLLPVVARPEGAIDGDELLKRGVKVVRPGMVVAAVEQGKAVEGFGVGEH